MYMLNIILLWGNVSICIWSGVEFCFYIFTASAFLGPNYRGRETKLHVFFVFKSIHV